MNIFKKIAEGRPLLMGVLNVTPDSFSDGGKYLKTDRAVKRALEMVDEGADIIDIGGESTGPGSPNVSADDELERVIPVFEKLRGETDAILSVDTYKSTVALHALKVGADMVNDVSALRADEGMAKVLAVHKTPTVIMYSKDLTPRTTRENTQYDDVVDTVKRFLNERIEYGVSRGMKRGQFILDPGMGAFVSADAKYSLRILKRLAEFGELGLPVLVGPSRKSFIGQVLDLPVGERMEGGFAAAAVAIMNGASILRVHDVKGTRRVMDMVYAITQS